MSAPSPQSACTMSPPGVRASTCAATGPTHGPSSRAGTSHAAPSTGRSSAASLASSVATRAERKRNASTTWPIASSSSVFSSPPARPAGSPRTQPLQASRPVPAGTSLGLERVRQCRRTGVVRAVAIAQVGERGQEVPGVAPLGREPRERPVQGLRGPGLVRVGAGCRLRVPALAGHVVGWGNSCGHGGRCYRRCPSWSGGGPSRRVTSEYLRKAENGSKNVTHASRLTNRLVLASFSVAGACFVASGVLERSGGRRRARHRWWCR